VNKKAIAQHLLKMIWVLVIWKVGFVFGSFVITPKSKALFSPKPFLARGRYKQALNTNTPAWRSFATSATNS